MPQPLAGFHSGTAWARSAARVRLLQPPVEGRVVRGFGGLDVGDKVAVTLLETDVEKGFVDFARARA